MRKIRVCIFTAIAAGILACTLSSFAQQADAIKAAADALGVANLKSLRFTSVGSNFSVGQNPKPDDPWPRVTIKNYDAFINYDTSSTRVEMVREQGVIPPR